ncbi:hypothetical protein ACFLZ4_00525 [Patescibacteria group bacterium]
MEENRLVQIIRFGLIVGVSYIVGFFTELAGLGITTFIVLFVGYCCISARSKTLKEMRVSELKRNKLRDDQK